VRENLILIPGKDLAQRDMKNLELGPQTTADGDGCAARCNLALYAAMIVAFVVMAFLFGNRLRRSDYLAILDNPNFPAISTSAANTSDVAA